MREAWPIAWYEFRQRLFPIVMNVLASLLVGAAVGGSVVRSVRDGVSYSDTYIIDFLLLATLPALSALSFTREYLSWSALMDEPFLKRLRFYRMWAIPLRVIAWSRMIFMLLCLSVSMICFFAMFILVCWQALSETWSFVHLFAYSMVWIGYATAFSGITPFLEYGAKAKNLLIGSIIMVFSVCIAEFIFIITLNQPLYLWLLKVVMINPLWPAVLSLCAAAAGIMLFARGLERRLARIDLP